MKVLVVSPEAVPFAKTGGLADVAGVLPVVLKTQGIDTTLILPLYKMVSKEKFRLRKIIEAIDIPISDRIESASVWEGTTENNVPVYFIEKDKYYNRDYLYGTSQGDYPDNVERFVFFSKAVLEVCKRTKFSPDIIHCNDWQSALVPLFIKTLYRDDPFFKETASVFTIHNLGYQGIFSDSDMNLLGVGWEYFTPEGIEFYGKINFLKAGLLFSEIITTVSETYSNEIQTEEYGFGLDGVLRKRSRDLYGVINGTDYNEWNPSTDNNIKERYDLNRIEGKGACKRDLQRQVGFVTREMPLIGMITRLAAQKGLDLVAEAIDQIVSEGFQVVILGTGEENFHRIFKDINRRYPASVSVNLRFDPVLARRIYAGSDFFLMPSRYEPCGLGQIISLRYGTIPIVRKTGGLADTVEEFNPDKGLGNGFIFNGYSSEDMLDAIRRAINVYKNKEQWMRIISNAMQCNFSWEASAEKYIKIYKKALGLIEGHSEFISESLKRDPETSLSWRQARVQGDKRALDARTRTR